MPPSPPLQATPVPQQARRPDRSAKTQSSKQRSLPVVLAVRMQMTPRRLPAPAQPRQQQPACPALHPAGCRHTFRSESNDSPKRVATVRRPRRPSPSLSTQLMVAAAGRLRLAPTPTACSSDCRAGEGGAVVVSRLRGRAEQRLP